MKIQLESGAGHNLIDSYRPGEIRINRVAYAASLIVTPERLITDWPPQRFADLTSGHFGVLLSLSPEVLLLGTGRRQRFPSPQLLAEVIGAGIGCEVMDTGAACRTYNILMGEGRRVVAALLPMGRED